MTRSTRQILLAAVPQGMPVETDFKMIETELPALEDGQVLIKSLYLSVDPYMRGRMNGAKTYIEGYALDRPITGGVVGEIVESKNAEYAVGDYVVGELPWADYSISDGKGYTGEELSKLQPERAPISTALSVMGMTGLTAYYGLLRIGQPKPGETVVVSGAAGAVGTIVGQIAKLQGARVVGIAGGAEKCRYLTEELGFDAVVDYKNTEDVRAALADACPDGVNVYFDNVGGEITEAVLFNLAHRARIIVCGAISAYNLGKPDMGRRQFIHLLVNSAMAQGFMVEEYYHENGTALPEIAGWIKEGKIKYRENVVEGLENTVDAFLGLFRGDNIGKQLVKVSE